MYGHHNQPLAKLKTEDIFSEAEKIKSEITKCKTF